MTARATAGLIYFTATVLFAGVGLAMGARESRWWMILLWPGMSFMLVGLAYVGVGPSIFGKRPATGSRAWPAKVILLPFLMISLLIWNIWRLTRAGEPCQEIAPGIWLGRRPRVHEMPPLVETLVDMTSEFQSSAAARGRVYFCTPTLDHTAPPLEVFSRLIDDLNARDGEIYIHCAHGHGRAAMVAAALLLKRRHAASIDEAYRQMKARRRGVVVNQEQRRLLERWMEKQLRGADAGASRS